MVSSLFQRKGGGKERLENHLKDDDFFGVSAHKEAILEFDSKSELKNGKYNINGLLTIKGITKPTDFELSLNTEGARVDMVFDRSKFDVKYRSSSFFSNLGDKLIYDDIELVVSLYF